MTTTQTLILIVVTLAFGVIVGLAWAKHSNGVVADDLDEDDDVLPPPPPPPWTGIDLAAWRERPLLIDWAASLYRTPEWHRVMEVLWSNQPIAVLSKETDYSAQLGRLQGYREAIAVLLELPKAPAITPTPPTLDYSGDAFGETPSTDA